MLLTHVTYLRQIPSTGTGLESCKADSYGGVGAGSLGFGNESPPAYHFPLPLATRRRMSVWHYQRANNIIDNCMNQYCDTTTDMRAGLNDLQDMNSHESVLSSVAQLYVPHDVGLTPCCLVSES